MDVQQQNEKIYTETFAPDLGTASIKDSAHIFFFFKSYLLDFAPLIIISCVRTKKSDAGAAVYLVVCLFLLSRSIGSSTFAGGPPHATPNPPPLPPPPPSN